MEFLHKRSKQASNESTNNSNRSAFFLLFYLSKVTLHMFLQTGVIMASGDIIAQLYLEKIQPRHLDIKRTARFGFIGMTFVASSIIYSISVSFSSR